MDARLQCALRSPQPFEEWWHQRGGAVPALVLVAHPDDEVFCAGLICFLVEKGVQVVVASFTRGEGARLCDSSPARTGVLRATEMMRSAKALGVSDVLFMDYTDRAAENGQLLPPHLDPSEATERTIGLIRKYQPALVVTHGSEGEYGHPAHVLIHRIVKAALAGAGSGRPTGLTFNAWHPGCVNSHLLNRGDPATLLVDARPFRGKKTAALLSHVSQLPVFASFGGGTAEDYISMTEFEYYAII